MQNKVGLINIRSFLKSMRFGLILLGVLGFFSVVGSFIPQGRDITFYYNNYTSIIAKTILVLRFNDLYDSLYFIILFGALCLNLLLCSITRFNKTFNKIFAMPDVKKMKNFSVQKVEEDEKTAVIGEIYRKYGFKSLNKMEKVNNRTVYYGKKNQMGYLGSWFIHIGVLLVIVFYGYGQYTFFSTHVYGVPGEAKEVLGTNYSLEINDFNIQYREDGSIEQYLSHVNLKNNGGDLLKAEDIFVNNPMRHDGYAIYQTATGWAADIKIYANDQLLKEDIFYEATTIADERGPVAIQFTKFYPDFISTENGISSRSNQLNNPKVLYTIFFMGQRVVMDIASIDESIHWYDYTFVFENPQMYTYFQVNKMKGKTGAMIGAVLILLGSILCFYIKPKEIMITEAGKHIEVFGNNIDHLLNT